MAALIILGIFLPGEIPETIGRKVDNSGRPGDGQREPPKISLIWLRKLVRYGLFALALFVLGATSFVVIEQDKIGHLNKIYGAGTLAPGKIIAVKGETGPQADILGPGFNFQWLVNIQYNVEQLPLVEVPDGYYGFISAKDGKPLRNGQYIADRWPAEKNFLDAKVFLAEKEGGQMGPQLTLLPPGKYRLNRYLFDVTTSTDFTKSTSVPAGSVAVIKSNVQELSADKCRPIVNDLTASLSVPLVPEGCVGVWANPYVPNAYYLNRRAYDVKLISTQVQAWKYEGGYTSRRINLTVDDKGNISQKEESIIVPTPEGAADKAIQLKVEGWSVYQGLRVVVQVKPEDASLVVASVGDLQAVEDKIISPLVESVVRTVTSSNFSEGEDKDIEGATDKEGVTNKDIEGATDKEGVTNKDKERSNDVRKVLYLQDRRAFLEEAVLAVIRPAAAKVGVTVREVRFSNPDIPPELMVARKREQLAEQLKNTFIQEQLAQSQRIEVERSRAKADQQSVLMQAEIAKEASMALADAKKEDGRGEKERLMEIAQGQQAQKGVLGPEMTFQLEALKLILGAAVANPEIVKVPMVSVQGQGGLEGAAATYQLLGGSNIVQGLQKQLGKSQ